MKHIIIDTDAGGDPDDILAVLFAINSPEIKVGLIITNDEHKTDRAKFVAKFLKNANKKIPVVAGKDLGNQRCFVVSELINEGELATEDNSLKIMADIISKSSLTYYACIGPQSNLARLITVYPELKNKIKIIIMGGRINHQFIRKTEHNIRYDVKAAKIVFESSWNKKYILSDITRNNNLRITEKSSFYQEVAKSKKLHIRLIKESIDCWFKNMYPESYMHDPLTLLSVFNDEVVTFKKEHILLQDDGKMLLDKMGKSTIISSAANYDLFWNIFKQRILM